MNVDIEQVTPMMRQYLETKKEYKDCILFYRLGDFYEMFFEDAEIVSKELELTLTGKSCGLEERAPMCGVPFHAVESYLTRLVSRGYKVAHLRAGRGSEAGERTCETRGGPYCHAGNQSGYICSGRKQK